MCASGTQMRWEHFMPSKPYTGPKGYDTNFADMSVTDMLAHIRRALKRAAP